MAVVDVGVMLVDLVVFVVRDVVCACWWVWLWLVV